MEGSCSAQSDLASQSETHTEKNQKINSYSIVQMYLLGTCSIRNCPLKALVMQDPCSENSLKRGSRLSADRTNT